MIESDKPAEKEASKKKADGADTGKSGSELQSSVAQAFQAIREATKTHPKMGAFGAVLALALVGCTTCVAFRFSPTSAVLFMGIAVAAAHLLTPWISGPTSASRNNLGRFMTWAFSILLLLGTAALGTQQVMCQFGFACPLPASPSQHVSFGLFSLLNENEVDTSKSDHVLQHASIISRDTVAHQPGTSPLVALATVISNYSERADGDIDVKIILFAGKDADNLQILDTYPLKSVGAWKSAGMVQRYPKGADAIGGPAGLLNDLRQQGLQIADNDLVALSTVTCFSKDILDAKSAVLREEVIDEQNHTYEFSRDIPITFVERAAQRSRGCSVG